MFRVGFHRAHDSELFPLARNDLLHLHCGANPHIVGGDVLVADNRGALQQAPNLLNPGSDIGLARFEGSEFGVFGAELAMLFVGAKLFGDSGTPSLSAACGVPPPDDGSPLRSGKSYPVRNMLCLLQVASCQTAGDAC